MEKSPEAFRTISEVAEWLGTPTHVLRFWESRFSQVKPVKRAGGRRYYRPTDMELLGGIKKLLHVDGMTIRGVQKLLREEGVRHVAAMSPPIDVSDAFEGQAEPVEPTAVDADVFVPEAPMDVDVEQPPIDNVVSFDAEQIAEEPIIEAADFERQDIEIGKEIPSPFPMDTASTEPVQHDKIEDGLWPQAADDAASDPFSHEPEPSLFAEQPAPDPEPEPEPVADLIAKPLGTDVPDDPEDDDVEIAGITKVAASLRSATDGTADQRPAPEVFAELYNRLVGLRERMDSRVTSETAD